MFGKKKKMVMLFVVVVAEVEDCLTAVVNGGRCGSNAAFGTPRVRQVIG